MSVITLTPTLLDEACHVLSRRVLSSGWHPVVIMGIQSGGAEVAHRMLLDFPDVTYCEVRLSRPGTQQKGSGMMHRLLQHLPLVLCDVLRMVESRINECLGRHRQQVRIGKISLPPDVVARLQSDTPLLLLVDDAIDTGATIQQALKQLLEQHPDLQIRVAAITVTTPQPECDADYCLYHNRTLCRFPWSNDYRF